MPDKDKRMAAAVRPPKTSNIDPGLHSWIAILYRTATAIYIVRATVLPVLLGVGILYTAITGRWIMLLVVLVISAAASLLVSSLEYKIAARLYEVWGYRAQAWARAVQDGLSPRFSLYLRPFELDGRMRDVLSFTFNSYPLYEDLEALLAYALEPLAPLIAVRGVRESFGPGSASLQTSEWQEIERAMFRTCEFLLVVPWDSESILWEIEELKTLELLHRCVFIQPRENLPVLSVDRWGRVANTLADRQLVEIPQYDREGLLFTVDQTGRLKASMPLPNGGARSRTRSSILQLLDRPCTDQ